MDKLRTLWFITGSQHLYGEETLAMVTANSRMIVDRLSCLPLELVWRPTVTGDSAVIDTIMAANADPACAGVILWMHTFSPARMWIGGLKRLQKPMLHFHTQFNRDLPFETIDMDFMNLNQSAHGDREFGYICTRLNMPRKIVVGHWSDPDTLREIADWSLVAAAWDDAQGMLVARIGDNMRDVAVTEGNKVDAEITLGYRVNGYGIGDLAEFINAVSEADTAQLLDEYHQLYTVKGSAKSIRDAARQELGMKAFLTHVGAKAFTTNFEDLHGMTQLMGLSSQRLMAQGYGFGAEGDWKTAALLRTMKIMAGCGGVSFMEDYTYHLEKDRELVLGAHMLEVCPSIAAERPVLDVHPLGIGGKADPARLIFSGAPGRALNASMVEFGGKFRLIVNEVETVECPHELPKLPVARVLWKPLPDFKSAVSAWLRAGGAHHTVYTQKVSSAQLRDYAEIAGVEYVLIN